MGRKTITLDEDVYDLVAGTKLGDDSFNDCLTRLARLHQLVDGVCEADESVLECAERLAAADDVQDAEPLTEDHLDDIGAEVESRVQRVLENARRQR